MPLARSVLDIGPSQQAASFEDGQNPHVPPVGAIDDTIAPQVGFTNVVTSELRHDLLDESFGSPHRFLSAEREVQAAKVSARTVLERGVTPFVA